MVSNPKVCEPVPGGVHGRGAGRRTVQGGIATVLCGI